MTLTNASRLPEAFARAAASDSYSRGDCDFTVTELLKPSRQRQLQIIYKDQITEDVRSRVWAVLGQAVHSVLERSARPGIDIIEKRVYRKFGSFVVSGQFDLLETDTGTLSDWKITKTYGFTKKGGRGKKPEHVAQLNMLRYLMHGSYGVEKLQIIGILKDWDDKKRFESGYPEAEVVKVDIPIHDDDKVEKFIMNRIVSHQRAQEKLPLCSVKETWGGVRCRKYCSASKFCDQFAYTQKTGLLIQEDDKGVVNAVTEETHTYQG